MAADIPTQIRNILNREYYLTVRSLKYDGSHCRWVGEVHVSEWARAFEVPEILRLSYDEGFDHGEIYESLHHGGKKTIFDFCVEELEVSVFHTPSCKTSLKERDVIKIDTDEDADGSLITVGYKLLQPLGWEVYENNGLVIAQNSSGTVYTFPLPEEEF